MTEDTNQDPELEQNTEQVVEKQQENAEGAEQNDEVTEQNEETSEESNADGAEDDESTENASETSEEVPAKPTKKGANDTIRTLRAEKQAAQAEKERLIHEKALAEAQLEQFRQQQQAAQSAAERKAEEERVALLDPQEQRIYRQDKQLNEMQHQLNQLLLQRRDDQDRAAFHAKAAHDETYAKYADKVEALYQDGLKRGVHASREDLHSWVLGQEVKKDLAAKTSKKKETASKRIESVTSKPASARGDVGGSKKGKSVEDRLRGVPI